MECNESKQQDYLSILMLVSRHDTGIGWYLIERALSRQQHPISQNGTLMELLKEMENDNLIQVISLDTNQHSVYIATEQGKRFVTSHGET